MELYEDLLSKAPNIIGSRFRLESLEFETDSEDRNPQALMLQQLKTMWTYAHLQTKNTDELTDEIRQLCNELPTELYRNWLDFAGDADGKLYTILHQCAFHGNINSIQTLLSLGANAHVHNCFTIKKG